VTGIPCWLNEPPEEQPQMTVEELEAELVEILRGMPYEKYLETSHWKHKRKMALERARYRCQVCNSNMYLNVHHRTYENLGNEQLEDLTVLCRDCHSLYHHQGEII